eukprot:CAMPEP_0201655346 /NCGR_PEP_ID=MMETSP0493-20130528/45963_1 /ASSEMBLY_ACC=CAM_ASM_000838 /TAXON_ID=420259 /ORGANISM="Thalassiosira gravida, Strain GMp14c1" /LENGTH=469 /DNA_ID=CAMNT_0048131929 /DNA_START=260 /DNA_END=1670 /DNA_ORIENTATION=+
MATTTPASTFRAKTNFMKSWRPRNPPSNRDRLELYALHKQALGGDAAPPLDSADTNNEWDRLELYALHKQALGGDAAPPLDSADTNNNNTSSSSSVGDKAKLNAWRGKRGMSREDAMMRYGEECERQLRAYGTRGDGGSVGGSAGGSAGTASSPPRPNAPAHRTNGGRAFAETRGGEPTAGSGTAGSGTSAPNRTSTPQNTPAADGADRECGCGSTVTDDTDTNDDTDEGALMCPRGLAAIPLLCAAASESRSAYLARLQVTDPNNGWWAKQEPLCLEINNPLSIPEKLIIALAAYVEQISLILSNYMGDGRAVSIMSPRVLQAFLWPVHNVFLCAWISLILTTTCLGSMVAACRTLLIGAKRTDAPLGRLFAEEVLPSARAAESLCEEHQAVGVRVAGLALMPLTMLCDAAASAAGKAGTLAGSLVFVGLGACGWWYWLCVLPWLAVCGLCLAVMSGWCFGLIELAGN